MTKSVKRTQNDEICFLICWLETFFGARNNFLGKFFTLIRNLDSIARAVAAFFLFGPKIILAPFGHVGSKLGRFLSKK